MTAVTLSKVSKYYQMGRERVAALSDVSLSIPANQFSVLAGPSGSGKSTLLNLFGCLDKQDDGEIYLHGESVRGWSDRQMTAYRATNIGFVFQNFNLLPVLTAGENIEYPLLMGGMKPAQRRERVARLIDEVGLAGKTHAMPGELSGGQRQRVAIARALAHTPKLVLADEPTANLDSATGLQIILLMRRLQHEHQTTFVFSSHDGQLIAHADRVFALKDGQLVQETP